MGQPRAARASRRVSFDFFFAEPETQRRFNAGRLGHVEFFFGTGEPLLGFGQEPDVSAGLVLPVSAWFLGFRCGHKATIPQAQRIVQQNAYNRQKNAVRYYMTTEKSKSNNEPKKPSKPRIKRHIFCEVELGPYFGGEDRRRYVSWWAELRGTGVEQWLKAKQNEVAGTSKIRTAFYRDQHKRFNGRH